MLILSRYFRIKTSNFSSKIIATYSPLFEGDFWTGARAGAHGRQLLQYQKSAKKRRRVATGQPHDDDDNVHNNDDNDDNDDDDDNDVAVSQRRAANIRERRRMFNLNEAFDRLRSKMQKNNI